MSLRWGILGPGRIAPRIVRGVGRSTRGELVAVASRDAERAEAFAARHAIARSFGSYEALLADPDIDVVYVALPNHLHAEWTVRALEAGKHVLCEKPLALSVDEVDRIAAAAERADRIAVEAFMYLHHPQTLRALELAASGVLGHLELVHGTFSFLLSQEDDPRIDPSMGGGSLWDVGCYPVSLARRIAGEEPDGLQAFARFDEQGVDRTFVGQLHFPGGLLAQFDSGFAAPDRERVEIVGGEARLVLDSPFLPEPDGPPPSLTLWRGQESTRIEVDSVDQYGAEVDDLTAAILDGTRPRVDLAFSRGTIAALVALDRAARSAVPGARSAATGTRST
jgi:D-xylose 1-dehydrogenase (NADP+, D-xylono-1,5-lactone-forming)